MGILDRYIIKKFLGTFFFSIALIISIAVVFDITEKLDDFIEKEAPLRAIVFDYYLNFIPYFANLFSFLFVFISVIFFTSKMASNTEIIAILSSGVSFKRFLLPYFISATVLASMSFYLNNFLIPDANKVRLTFEEQYIRNPFTNTEKNIHIQLDDSTYAYFESYNSFSDIGYKFSLETIKEGILTYKLISDFARWDSVKTGWSIFNYYERYIDGTSETIKEGRSKDTTLNITPDDFNKRSNAVEMLDYYELNDAIAKEKFRGSHKAVYYELEKYGRIASPFATFILTLIGVSIASRKVRGGIGVHIGVGLAISFTYILFMQISETFATNGNFNPIIAVWIPNILYGLLAVYLLIKSPK
jgi:lipopolysaccharide export system permease protein